MKPHHCAHRGGARERGLTLIELMISLTIGLILILAVISTYLGSANAGRVADAQARMNEDAQAVLSILSQQIRMAGNNPRRPNFVASTPSNPIYDTSTYFLRGCDGTFTDVGTANLISNLTCTAGTNSSPDSIAISYEADIYNTLPNGPQPTDCLGQNLPTLTGTVSAWNGSAIVGTTTVYYAADNRYYVSPATATAPPSFYCKGNGGSAAQPMVENIEDLQFMYGTAPATGTVTMAGYLSANEVVTQSTLAALPDDPSRWARVITARICVLVRSENPVVSDAASAQYTKCDGSLETNPPDLRLRRAYTTTVIMRNRVSTN